MEESYHPLPSQTSARFPGFWSFLILLVNSKMREKLPSPGAPISRRDEIFRALFFQLYAVSTMRGNLPAVPFLVTLSQG
jgi:hypothetical protein